MIHVSEDHIRKIAPGCLHPEKIVMPLNGALSRYDISKSGYRIAAFLAQVAVESQDFTRTRENLYYTSASRICQVWPKRFPTAESALPFVRNPQGLANRVYADRVGNGSEQSNDGWNFRGGGWMMTTGRANYSVLESEVGIDLLKWPDQIENTVVSAVAAGKFWQSHGLNALSDVFSGAWSDYDFKHITEIVNGGQNGAAERFAKFKVALPLFI